MIETGDKIIIVDKIRYTNFFLREVKVGTMGIVTRVSESYFKVKFNDADDEVVVYFDKFDTDQVITWKPFYRDKNLKYLSHIL